MQWHMSRIVQRCCLATKVTCGLDGMLVELEVQLECLKLKDVGRSDTGLRFLAFEVSRSRKKSHFTYADSVELWAYGEWTCRL